MPSISRSHSFVQGEIPTPAQFNVDIDAIITLLNGLLDADNVDTSVVATMATANTFTALQTFSAGYANGIAIGNLRIWYDSTNGLAMYKHGIPTSDTDGDVWV